MSYLVAEVFPPHNPEREEQACRGRYKQAAPKPDRPDVSSEQKQTPSDQSQAADAYKEAGEYCVQRRAAKASERQADYALWGLILSGLALIGLFGTVVYTADAAQSAADAARHTARSVDVQIRLEQPLLFFRMASHVEPPDWQRIDVFVANYGKTPAVIIEWSAECRAIDDLPKRATYSRITKSRGIPLLPSDGGREVDLAVILKDDDAQAIASDQATAHLWGYVKFEDALGRTRVKAFCFKCEPFMLEENGFPVPASFGLLWVRAGGKTYNYEANEIEI